MQIKLKNVRLSFPQLSDAQLEKAKSFDGKPPKYAGEFILPLDTAKDQIEAVKAAIKNVAAEKWGQKADAIVKGLDASKCCLKDGVKRAKHEGYEGTMYVKASNDVRPGLYDSMIDPKTGKVREIGGKENRLYGGCYVNARIDIYAYHHEKGGDQVNAKLLGVQFLKDGDAFVGAPTSAPDDFDPSDIGSEDPLM